MTPLKTLTVHRIQDYLVRLGPDNALVRTALRIHARRYGYEIEFPTTALSPTKPGVRWYSARRTTLWSL